MNKIQKKKFKKDNFCNEISVPSYIPVFKNGPQFQRTIPGQQIRSDESSTLSIRSSCAANNFLFTKPKAFLEQFTASRKDGLLLNQVKSKYETPIINRNSLTQTPISASILSSLSKNTVSSKISKNSNATSLILSKDNISSFTSTPRNGSCSYKLSASKTCLYPKVRKNCSSKKYKSTPASTHPENKATPKSSSSATTASSKQPRVIIAITEGRGNAQGEVGLAAIDTHHPCLVMCQISDTHSYHNVIVKLNVLNPHTVIFPNTFSESQNKSKLLEIITKKFPNVILKSLSRKYFNDAQGLSSIKSLHLPEDSSIEFLVMRKYYTLSAVAALLKYVDYFENISLAPKSLAMEYQAVEKMMLIDFETMYHLELILSQAKNEVANSFFGVLNHCLTFSGQKRLRSAILQPPFVQEDIKDRLDSVTELVENPELLYNVQNTLSKLRDVESLLKVSIIPRIQKPDDSSLYLINYILLLQTTLNVLPNLFSTLSTSKTKNLKKVAKCLEDPRFGIIASEIGKVLNDDSRSVKGYAESQFQRCYAIKAEINGLLDVSRYTYSELVSDFGSKVAELAKKYELPLQWRNSGAKGFHIQLNIKGNKHFKKENLPDEFIQINKAKNTVTMNTEELVCLNERIKQALAEVLIMSNVLLQELMNKIRENTGCLFNLCENIAELDLLVSHARISSSSNYSRPVFSQKLILKASRHPILDFILPAVPVPNDVFCSNAENFHIITGPNMGGKSIYIKQIALLQIMAQIGCYVPAEYAEFRLINQLFSRIGFDDSIECGASTFILELREMNHILRSATKNSLVIIDEFCRGTSNDAGNSIAWAVSEALMQTEAFTFFATHLMFLPKLQDFYPNVFNWYFEANIINDSDRTSKARLQFTHKLKPGIVSVEHYGLKLAEMTAIPDSLKDIVHDLAQSFSTVKESRTKWYLSNETAEDLRIDKLCLKLLNLMDENKLTLCTLIDSLGEQIMDNSSPPQETVDSSKNISPLKSNDDDKDKFVDSILACCENKDIVRNESQSSENAAVNTYYSDNDILGENIISPTHQSTDSSLNESPANAPNVSLHSFGSLKNLFHSKFEKENQHNKMLSNSVNILENSILSPGITMTKENRKTFSSKETWATDNDAYICDQNGSQNASLSASNVRSIQTPAIKDVGITTDSSVKKQTPSERSTEPTSSHNSSYYQFIGSDTYDIQNNSSTPKYGIQGNDNSNSKLSSSLKSVSLLKHESYLSQGSSLQSNLNNSVNAFIKTPVRTTPLSEFGRLPKSFQQYNSSLHSLYGSNKNPNNDGILSGVSPPHSIVNPENKSLVDYSISVVNSSSSIYATPLSIANSIFPQTPHLENLSVVKQLNNSNVYLHSETNETKSSHNYTTNHSKMNLVFSNFSSNGEQCSRSILDGSKLNETDEFKTQTPTNVAENTFIHSLSHTPKAQEKSYCVDSPCVKNSSLSHQQLNCSDAKRNEATNFPKINFFAGSKNSEKGCFDKFFCKSLTEKSNSGWQNPNFMDPKCSNIFKSPSLSNAQHPGKSNNFFSFFKKWRNSSQKENECSKNLPAKLSTPAEVDTDGSFKDTSINLYNFDEDCNNGNSDFPGKENICFTEPFFESKGSPHFSPSQFTFQPSQACKHPNSSIASSKMYLNEITSDASTVILSQKILHSPFMSSTQPNPSDYFSSNLRDPASPHQFNFSSSHGKLPFLI